MRNLRRFGWVLVLLLASCGGGGGGGGSSSAPISTSTSTTTPISTSPASNPVLTVAGTNVATMVVEAGPQSTDFANVPFVTVTICQPSTSNCVAIDHVQVDTGSSGLRLVSTNAITALGLSGEMDTSGNALAECAQFADGISWGVMRVADVQIAGEIAPAIPLQIIADPSIPNIPSACASQGALEDTVATLGANGILGVGNFLQDCGATCATNTTNLYFGCASSTCHETTAQTTTQTANPVGAFTTDNNGVVLELPSVPTLGATTATGALIFGIGTQTNNALGSAAVLTLDPVYGDFSAQLGSTTYASSFLDSGSTGYFLALPYPSCPSDAGYYCPAASQTLTATNTGQNGVSSTVNFTIANAQDIFDASPNAYAFSNLGGTNSIPQSIDYGLTFFFGRSVFSALEVRSTPAGMGPYVAY